ncbi:MAG: T9SS type A sorting domain-containing protein [Tannerella sp.]|jgi:hypothetical protein|nr:T9SS type A sorting domain-containing protein [Tannerella sp.]
MKEKILFILLSIPFFAYSQKVEIAGEKQPVFGKFETYIVENHPKTNGGDATWRVVGGTFDGINTTTLSQSVEKNKVSVKWNETSSGSLYYNYEGYYGQIDVKPQKGSTEEPPPATGPKASIRYSGSNKTYNNISFYANYDLAGTVISGSPEYKWTFNNGGTITTRTGTSATLFFPNIGKLEILLEVTVKTSGGGYTIVTKATESISLVDGTLEAPILKSIDGQSMIGVGSINYFSANHNCNFPNLKYEWSITYLGRKENLGNATSIYYTFNESGYYVIWCTITNTKTGKSSTAYKNIEVKSGHAVQSIDMPIFSFQVLNLNDALIVTDIGDESEYVQIRSGKQISYQINNALTGILADQGKVINGNSIDISRLSKGIYVVTLDNGTIKETHKISVK